MTYQEKKQAFISAVRLGKADEVRKILEESPELAGARFGMNKSALHVAAEYRQKSSVIVLLELLPHQAAVEDDTGRTPLSYADTETKPLIASSLLQARY